MVPFAVQALDRRRLLVWLELGIQGEERGEERRRDCRGPAPYDPALPAPSAPQEPTQLTPGTAEPAPEPVSVDGIGKSTSESTAGVRSDVPGNGIPSSIRYNNPGAQDPRARAAAFGQIGYGTSLPSS